MQEMRGGPSHPAIRSRMEFVPQSTAATRVNMATPALAIE